MPVRQPALCLPLLAILLFAGLSPAVARDDAFSDARPRRVRVDRRPIVPAPVYAAPPAIVSGFLPRNHGVPMYNEPPALRERDASWR